MVVELRTSVIPYGGKDKGGKVLRIELRQWYPETLGTEDWGKYPMNTQVLAEERYDNEDRRNYKPDKVQSVIQNTIKGVYEERGCNLLGGEWKDGVCEDKKKSAKKDQKPTSKEPKKQKLTQTIIRRKR